MTRTLRERLAELERHGVALVCVVKGKHRKLHIAAPDGRAWMVVVSRTPPDWRAGRKFRAQIRRFATGSIAPALSRRRPSSCRKLDHSATGVTCHG
jgi:hypothetical protein